ncbi:pancreatic progenitor cell differentiation and proliferation factor-like protein isoform X1 [Pongo pygmaeus]|uniref:pancreatic progenitor cell differentiation and proliferation factor-like protein isoform X1 n=1 Tax=Pongo pygmaeus TaxID=9600 RepID=UPI00300D087D
MTTLGSVRLAGHLYLLYGIVICESLGEEEAANHEFKLQIRLLNVKKMKTFMMIHFCLRLSILLLLEGPLLEYVRDGDSERIPSGKLNQCMCRFGNQKLKDQLAGGINQSCCAY